MIRRGTWWTAPGRFPELCVYRRRQHQARRRVCPVCGGSMVERTGPYGQFLGCGNYRRGSDFLCTHTENLGHAGLSRQGSADRQALRG